MATQPPTVELASFQIIRHRQWRFTLLSCLTLGLYSAYRVLRDAQTIGQLVGKRRVGLVAGLGLTLITLGVFPGIYLVVLAFDLQRHSQAHHTANRLHHLGAIVLALDILSLAAAIASGGFAVIVSVFLWTYACWLLVRELALYAPLDV